MMNRAAVAGTLLLSLATVAHADDEAPAPAPATQTTQTTQTTTAQTLVVVTPNAPVVITNGQQQSAPVVIAPPGAAEAPAATSTAPLNENWNNVSHINGSVVPVGDRNAYLYNFKKNNIQSNPLAWMFGYYQVAASHALTQNIALSVELSGWNTDHGYSSGYQLAATLPIYFKRTFSGPFLEPGLVVHSDNNSNSYDDCYDCSYDTTSSMSHVWAGPEVMVGWAWMFDSGLNMSAAFGAAKRMSDNQDNSSDDPVPVGYFRVGYAF
jgi:hypothetical protein